MCLSQEQIQVYLFSGSALANISSEACDVPGVNSVGERLLLYIRFRADVSCLLVHRSLGLCVSGEGHEQQSVRVERVRTCLRCVLIHMTERCGGVSCRPCSRGGEVSKLSGAGHDVRLFPRRALLHRH